MHYSAFSRLRDILFLLALFFLAKTALERTSSFINAHRNSIVHELDRNFIDEIYRTQRQLHKLEENIHSDDHAHLIAEIKERLITIEEKYKKNSPGIMLLGPIGSAAIVSKEEKLQKKLLEVLNDINKVLHTVNNKTDQFLPIENMHTALESNKKLLQQLIA